MNGSHRLIRLPRSIRETPGERRPIVSSRRLNFEPAFVSWQHPVSSTGQSIRARDVEPMLIYCWPRVGDSGPTLNQHWFSVSRFLGSQSVRGALFFLTDKIGVFVDTD